MRKSAPRKRDFCLFCSVPGTQLDLVNLQRAAFPGLPAGRLPGLSSLCPSYLFSPSLFSDFSFSHPSLGQELYGKNGWSALFTAVSPAR